MDNAVRINGPDPYYIEFDCLNMLGGRLTVGDWTVLRFKRDVPFRENLPVVLVTPYDIGVPQRMSFEILEPSIMPNFVGDGILDGWLTLEFRPAGREMLAIWEPFQEPFIMIKILAPV